MENETASIPAPPKGRGSQIACTASGVPCEDAVFIAIEMGENIIRCGGEIHRAEDTVIRICRAYGAVTVDVNAILSMIVMTADFGEESINSFRKVSEVGGNNLGRLSKLNDLSRRICRERPTKDEFLACIERIDKCTEVGMLRYLVGSILLSAGFALYFGGSWLDTLFAILIALPMCFLHRCLGKTKTNAIIAKFVVCFAGGVGAMLIGKTGLDCNVNTIMIADIMNVVPGMALTNSFRDLFGGDIMSGLFRLCMVLLDAVAIACGYAVAILIFGGAA